jgi:hypothetical protein
MREVLRLRELLGLNLQLTVYSRLSSLLRPLPADAFGETKGLLP